MRAEVLRLPMTLLLLTALSACDPRSAGKDFKAERANRAYQKAMQELSAGRLQVAADAFKAVIKADPGNTSAHFQLACLLQDQQHDYLGAIGEYRVFLLLASASEKTAIAKERIARCEQLHRERTIKDDATKVAGTLRTENEQLSQSLGEAKARFDRLKTELTSLQTKLAAEQQENARLRTLIEGHAVDHEAPKLELVSTRELLEEEEEPLAPAALSEAMRLAAEAEAEDVAAGSRSALLGDSSPAASTNLTGKTGAKSPEVKMPSRPSEYVVQNGDTLYKIANQFYGRTAAWKAIRDANKAIISTDGRVRAGQKIRLP